MNNLPDNNEVKQKIIEAMKMAYIKSDIKISDDDPIIAVIYGQTAVLEVYSEIVNERLNLIEQGLSQFPIRIQEDLEVKASALIQLLNDGSNALNSAIDGEIKNSQDKISEYADSMVKLCKNKIDNITTPKQSQNGGILKIITISFFTSLLGALGAIAIAYNFLTL